MPYTYRYVDDDGAPLTVCPDCRTALTRQDGVNLLLSVGGRLVEVPTRLDDRGRLVDTEDGAVAKGFYSGAECHFCGYCLVDHEAAVT